MNKWWFDSKDYINRKTPSWDFVCTAEIDGKPGLILVEAKAHDSELSEKDSCKAKDSSSSYKSINKAINDIRDNYNFELDIKTHYQLSNRIAWSIKLCELGIPVILIYLGFLNCKEMGKGNSIFISHNQWKNKIEGYSKKVKDPSIWNCPFPTKNEIFYPLICSLDLQLDSKVEMDFEIIVK